MSRISALIIEPDQEAMRQADAMCRKTDGIDLRWKANTFETGMTIARKHRPDVAIVGLGDDPLQATDLIAALAKDSPFLFIIALSGKSDADLILQAMRAGAHDFLRKPVREVDLAAAFEKVTKLKSRREPVAEGGKIVSAFSNKGGSGTTATAVNLAYALARHHGKKVVAVDLALARGDMALFFNVKSAYSILDLARNADKADYDFLHSLLVRHASGVYVLADPPLIEDGDRISAEQIREALTALRSIFDIVVVDTPHQFDERTLTALEMSDVVLLISLLDLPSLRNAQRCLELFGRIGLRDERIRFVLNRRQPSDEIPEERVAGILSCPVFFSIPNDYPAMMSSINRGKPLHEIAPGKDVTKSFHQMADLLMGSEAKEKPSGKKAGFFGRIFQFERSSP